MKLETCETARRNISSSGMYLFGMTYLMGGMKSRKIIKLQMRIPHYIILWIAGGDENPIELRESEKKDKKGNNSFTPMQHIHTAYHKHTHLHPPPPAKAV